VIDLTSPTVTSAAAGAEVSDAEILAISTKHCIICHAQKPAHESFQEPPKNVILETIDDIKRHAVAVMVQTVENRAMPPGNQTIMTDAERETLARWIRALH